MGGEGMEGTSGGLNGSGGIRGCGGFGLDVLGRIRENQME